VRCPVTLICGLGVRWHGRRRVAAAEERLAALAEVHRVSQENVRLLTQQRQFLQDAWTRWCVPGSGSVFGIVLPAGPEPGPATGEPAPLAQSVQP
jgi:hypothetical protein